MNEHDRRIFIANLLFSGLSVDELSKIPKWLLDNADKNNHLVEEFRVQTIKQFLEYLEGVDDDMHDYALSDAYQYFGWEYIELNDTRRS